MAGGWFNSTLLKKYKRRTTDWRTGNSRSRVRQIEVHECRVLNGQIIQWLDVEKHKRRIVDRQGKWI